jgi:hypothetical protein
MARKRSPEGRIIAYFSFEPMDEAKRMLLMVHEVMRERLGVPEKPKRLKLVKHRKPSARTDFESGSPLIA